MSRHTPLAAIIVAVLTPFVAASTILHDETFTPNTWTAAIFSGTNVTGTVAVVQQINGRGPGSNSQQVSVFHNAPTFTFDMQMFKNDRPWVPSTDGEIVSFLWKLDYLCHSTAEDPIMYATARRYFSPRRLPYGN